MPVFVMCYDVNKSKKEIDRLITEIKQGFNLFTDNVLAISTGNLREKHKYRITRIDGLFK